MSTEFFKNIFTQNPPSLYTRSVDALRLAQIFANSAETSVVSIDNRHIPRQEIPVHVAETAENVLSELKQGRDLPLAAEISRNLTAAFNTLETAKASPDKMKETLSQIREIATASLAPKAA